MFKKILIISFLMISILLLQGYTDNNIFKNGENIIIEKNDSVQNVVCINGSVTINGTVEENVLVLYGNVSIGREAVIKGELVVIGGTIDKSRNSKLEGGTTALSSEQVTKISNALKVYQPKQPRIFKYIEPILCLSFLLVILLIVLLFPKTIGGISFVAESKPWKTLGVGIISFLLIVPISVLLLISLIGITLIPLFFITLILVMFFGSIAIIQLLGKKTSKVFTKKGIPMVWETIIGIIVLHLLKLLPIFGGVITIVICTFALGAGVLYLTGLRKKESPPLSA